MKLLGCAALFMLLTAAVQAQVAPVTISDQNASLTYTIDVPGAPLSQPNDPVQLPRKLEWTVDGRRILVYPSGPSTLLDIGHLHLGAHVQTNQMHAQGPLIGYGSGAISGRVVGALVYSVHGGAAGSGMARISEKLDLHNKSGAPLAIALTGMGFRPSQAALELPDHEGHRITGTTVVFVQGNAQAGSLTEPPFAPLAVLPVVAFNGFNPLLNQPYTLADGATMTMVTELKVEPDFRRAMLLPWIALVSALAVAGVAWRLRRP